MRSMWRSRTSIGRSSTIGSRRRSIRSRSSSSPTLFSARRRPRGRAARWRGLGMIGVVALLRLLGFVSIIVGVRVPGVARRAIRRALRRDGRRVVADLARPGRRACGGDLEVRDRQSPNASRGRWRVEERADGHRHPLPLLRIALSQFRRRLLHRRGRACRHDRLCRADAPRRRLAQSDRVDSCQDLAFPRPAAHRAHHAVHRAGRRDVVLPRRSRGASNWSLPARPASLPGNSWRRR